jgi:hypothetical protein
MGDTGSITVWLAIIAIASLVQVLILLGAAIVALRVYRRTTAALEVFQREEIKPMLTRVHSTLDEVHDVMARVRDVDETVRRRLSHTTERASQAASRVRSGLWPIVGLGRGVWAALASFRRRQPMRPMDTAEGEARFAYQGGTSHVRS